MQRKKAKSVELLKTGQKGDRVSSGELLEKTEKEFALESAVSVSVTPVTWIVAAQIRT